MEHKLLHGEHTKKRLEKLQKTGKITDVQKDELFAVMTTDDKSLQIHNKSNEPQKNSSYVREVYDDQINAGLKKYESNQTLVVSEKEKIENYGGVKELISYTSKYNKIWESTYLEQRKTWTPEQKAIVEKIESESGGKVKCIVDPKFINLFSKTMGVHYAGSALLGERIAVRSPEYLKAGLLNHEAIHCLQQRDAGGGKWGFLRWLSISLPDLGKKFLFSDSAGLAEAMDFATDNQITDLETYMNQYTDGYLKNRPKNIHKKYKDPAFLRQEYARIRDTEYQELLTQRETVRQSIEQELDPKHKLELEVESNHLDAQVAQMERVIQKLDGADEVRVVMIGPDKPNTEKDSEKFGNMTETAKNREIRLPMERFIQKHGKKADGYREGVDLWIKLQSLIKDISEKNKLTPEESKKLGKDAIYLVNRYGEHDGMETIKRKYPTESL